MKIVVPAGIGDYSWIHSKLSTLGIPFDVIAIGVGEPRLLPFLEILPCIRNTGVRDMSFADLRACAIPAEGTTRAELLAYPDNAEIPVEVNTPLEGGVRLEKCFSDIDVDFHYEINITEEHIEAATELMPKEKFICIFAANELTAKTWSGWLAAEWVEFMLRFKDQIADLPFVIIGAHWDGGLGEKIVDRARRHGVQITDMIGKFHIGASLHVVRSANYTVSFPSGIGVLANVMNCPVTMFYPEGHKSMIGSWGDPKDIASGDLYESVFIPPLQLIDWLRDTYHLQDKL